MRRGGRTLFALDLSAPATPAFKWMIDNTTTGFSELGQTWSDPVPTTVPGYVDGSGKHKPVLVFGGGFDAANKDTTLVASADSMGRAIYIVDADSGALLWSVSPAASTGANLQETGLEHGIAARTMVLDSNGDGVTDRIYAADTGGNVWRVDLPGTDRSKWGIVKFAALNGGDVANDRRFFNRPDIVRTRQGSMAFDAVLLGSGERNNPLAKDVNNRFYQLQDRQIAPYYSANPTTAECGTDSTPGSRYSDYRCSLPLGEGDLYDATENLVQDGSTTEVASAQAALYSSSGWYITLERSGEKSLSSSITVSGNVVFTTFAPETVSTDQCVPEPGQGYFYAVSLLNAASVYNFTGEVEILEKNDRVAVMGKMLLGTPTPHVDEDGRIRMIFPAGGTAGTEVEEMEGSIFDTGNTISGAKADYWYQEEY
jgi:type IV pilus assembly protein PilY1